MNEWYLFVQISSIVFLKGSRLISSAVRQSRDELSIWWQYSLSGYIRQGYRQEQPSGTSEGQSR